MAMQEDIIDPIAFPRMFGRSRRKASVPPANLPLRDDALFQETAAQLNEEIPVLSSGAFIEELDVLEASVDREEAMEALVSLSQAEVRGVIRLAAKAKARYLAALVDLSQRTVRPDHAVGDLRNLRERCEELSTGVARLKSMILNGDVQVQGIGS